MPSNEQRRQAAKRKLERQLERRAVQAKRRRTITIGATIVVVIAVVVGVFYFTRTSDDTAQPETPPQAQPGATPGPCAYAPTAGEPAAKPVGAPPDPEPTPAEGVENVTFQTSEGAIPMTLDRSKAPCTVQSFEHLVQAKYFDGTECHRLTTGEGLKVLQCGDPTGTGSGGPGYSIKDEPPADLKPAPSPYDRGGATVYPRGTLAMAKSSMPNSGGSQFFMVYQDSYLPPEYTVFGTVGEEGLSVLDKVAAAGVTPVNGEGDGSPNIPVKIERASANA
ncbi:peptidyl-prolyl cis-trans isomerase B (cyclophilin B) [Saccharopolyspora kobensis]|uniref:Peptidyl-prolyl cis-trans isomerase B (Cyclophilin B) n=1 Tax=Saccharopolyspora kobensis TaxID=146035 RepID=A0A1H6CD34_9PSEU|nr:peptidylprolyl isomerase [Saccharopolyspora kobensis]SEG70891.1 peptidyl-prolyl cis-trans isomerase B (cyclophilin B) [Saccharopolyspora kobensis]SFC36178.1 peptidyl-prolyl cis-trans isomerase B (cyclophilin B) [Saccharopolyspora kobensis]